MSRLRVMTFNIANALETEDDGENAWALRAPLNVRTIQRYTPDLIGFQQFDDGNLETYQSPRWPNTSISLVLPPTAPTSTAITLSPICQSGWSCSTVAAFISARHPRSGR